MLNFVKLLILYEKKLAINLQSNGKCFKSTGFQNFL